MIGHYLTHSTRRLTYWACLLGLTLLVGCADNNQDPPTPTTENTPAANASNEEKITSDLPVYQQWHSVTLDFEGPDTSEQDADNPFLNYRLIVTFTQDGREYPIRGYYAADGQAAASGADAGNIWQVKFRAPETGRWQYRARLERGEQIALRTGAGDSVPLDNATGTFMVEASDKKAPDFRALGRLSVNDGYFYFPDTDQYWLKGGSNSPENFLAYEGFDGTYRIAASAREGEASANSELHQYESHRQDWQPGDPTLRGDTGKSIFGAVNYLAEKGMNAIYLLTMNIEGDGKDVWPYTSPEDFTRFDVSRLAQWEQLFQHMQNKGILIHLVTQETENERLLDDGDVGPMRTLYYQELIARFGHHLGLIWNLGEENGYAEWSPPAQNTEQRKAMIRFFEQADPYQNPVVLHTHAEINTREPVLEPLLGIEGLDGLSLQAHDRQHAHQVVMKWKERSEQAGQRWLITMDEIGMWHTGADTDENDPGHPSLRGDVLWGTLLSGAAGVEWYFGAHNPHNDLTSEDWRKRDELWSLTRHAMTFFRAYLPWWDMAPAHDLLARDGAFCLARHDDIYALYFPTDTEQYQIDLSGLSNDFEVHWYNPVSGGDLSSGSVTKVEGGAKVSLGNPPGRATEDWVVLLRKTGR